MEPLTTRDPKTFGEFTLIGRLGAGGMGVVYLASRRSESVALKVIREHLMDDPSQASRFAREIETLQAIDSPSVARLVESGTDDEGRVWFATEFVNGPDLDSRVKDRGALSTDEWWAIAEDVLAGIAAAHEVGVTHRDIKPANVIISESGAKLIDFGIAQISDATSVTSTGLVAGTPAWFSPEQIEGLTVTAATDVFSAGSVLVFAANGRTPWGDQTTMTKASVFKILTAEPDLEELDDQQRELATAMLQKEPSARPAASVLLANLEAFRDGTISAADLFDGAGSARSSTTLTPKASLRGSSSPYIQRLKSVPSSPTPARTTRTRPPINWKSPKLIAVIAISAVVLLGGGSVGALALQNVTGPIEVSRSVDGSNQPIGNWSLSVTNETSGGRSEWGSRDRLRILYTPPYSEDETYDATVDASELGLSGFTAGQVLNANVRLTTNAAIITLAVGDGEPLRTISLSRENEQLAIDACARELTNQASSALSRFYGLGQTFLAQLEGARLASVNTTDGVEFLLYSEWSTRMSALASAVPAETARIQADAAGLPQALSAVVSGKLSEYSGVGQAAQSLGIQYQNLLQTNAASNSTATDSSWNSFYESARSMFYGYFPWSASDYEVSVEQEISDASATQCATEIE